MKLCRDCVHCVAPNIYLGHLHMCDMIKSPVNGRAVLVCEDERAFGACGAGAEFFEPIDFHAQAKQAVAFLAGLAAVIVLFVIIYLTVTA